MIFSRTLACLFIFLLVSGAVANETTNADLVAEKDWEALAVSNLERIIKTLEPEGRAKLQNARKADSPEFPKFGGTWYGTFKEPGTIFVWKITRSADGKSDYKDLQLFHDTRKYKATDDQYRWVLIGRLLIEVYPEDPDEATVFLIETTSESSMSYWMVMEDSPLESWFLDTEQRTEISFPEVPANYNKME